MASEVRRGFSRILTNYARLFITLSLGIVFVKLMCEWVTLEGFGLVALVGATTGFAALFAEMSQEGVVRELGAAWHTKDVEHFQRVYSSSFVVSGVVSLLTVVTTVIAWIVVPYLKIPPEWIGPARWIVATQGVYAAVSAIAAPAYSMYVVLERFARYNFWQVCIRMTQLVSLVVLAYLVGITDTEEALTAFGIMWASLLVLTMIAAVVTIAWRNRVLRPRFDMIDREALRRIMHTFGWNSVAKIGLGLHEKCAAVLMNLAFGVFGNGVFAVAIRLAAYVRMAVSGVTGGLDAVSARVSSDDRDQAVRSLIRNMTRLQSMIAIPGGLVVFILAEPLLELWVARNIENPEHAIPLAVTIVQILAFAITSRSIAHGWMMILYGSGHVRHYAPLVLAAGIGSPVLGGLLLLALPESIRINAPALGYSAALTLAHVFLMPLIGKKCLDMPYRDFVLPILSPIVATAICSPILIIAFRVIDDWSLLHLLMVGGIFGVVYAAMSWIIVLDASERSRFANAARRRLPFAVH